MPNRSDSFIEEPMRQLDEGIQRLKELAGREADPARKQDILARIADIERRRDNYLAVLEDDRG